MVEMTSENHLFLIRDIITEMQPNLHFKENTTLCYNRIGKIMEMFIFNDERVVVSGLILCFNGK